jgi:hypothetical protein
VRAAAKGTLVGVEQNCDHTAGRSSDTAQVPVGTTIRKVPFEAALVVLVAPASERRVIATLGTGRGGVPAMKTFPVIVPVAWEGEADPADEQAAATAVKAMAEATTHVRRLMPVPESASRIVLSSSRLVGGSPTRQRSGALPGLAGTLGEGRIGEPYEARRCRQPGPSAVEVLVEQLQSSWHRLPPRVPTQDPGSDLDPGRTMTRRRGAG